MLHVDDYLDSPDADPIAKEFLEQARRPAITKDAVWLAANAPDVDWCGKPYVCVGASRLGDVWLRNQRARIDGHYDLRVDVAELSNWRRPSTSSGDANG